MQRQIRSPYLLTAIAIGLFAVAIWYARSAQPRESPSQAKGFAHIGCESALGMFRRHRSDAWLTISGTVARTLGDAYRRFQHQRFILACTDGLTVLIVNDVSIGQRAPVEPGHKVTIRGEYVWDSQGGLVHFTHHADTGPGGWILYSAHVYQ